jgi:hypothetical protein
MPTYTDGTRTVTLELREETSQALALNGGEILSADLNGRLRLGGILTGRTMHDDCMGATVEISDAGSDPKATLQGLLRKGWEIESPQFSRPFTSRNEALAGCIRAVPEFRDWAQDSDGVLGVEEYLKQRLGPPGKKDSPASLSYHQGVTLITTPGGFEIRLECDTEVHSAVIAHVRSSYNAKHEVPDHIGLLELGWRVSTEIVIQMR